MWNCRPFPSRSFIIIIGLIKTPKALPKMPCIAHDRRHPAIARQEEKSRTFLIGMQHECLVVHSGANMTILSDAAINKHRKLCLSSVKNSKGSTLGNLEEAMCILEVCIIFNVHDGLDLHTHLFG